MKRSWAVALLLPISPFLGCKGEEAPPPAPVAAAPASAPTAEPSSNPVAAVGEKLNELDAFLKDDSAALTPELEEKFLLGMKDCAVTADGIDPKCEGLKAWNKSRGKKTVGKSLLGGSNNLGAKHIGHESAAIRLKSAELMGSIFGSGEGSQKILLEAAAKETEPAVLAAMIRQVGSRHKQNPDIKALLLKAADHEAEKVRIEAMGWFLTSFGEGLPDTWKKVEEKLAKDPSEKVRAYLCSRLYGSSNDKAIGWFAKILNDKKTPDALYDGCFGGVVHAWTGFPFPAKPNKKAYELTLKVLEKKPRTEQRPPWTNISTLRAAKSEFKDDDKFGKEWWDKVKAWYKKDKLCKALEGIVADSKAGWIARASSVDTLKELGANKADLEKIAAKLSDKSTDGMVKKKLEDALKAMP